MGEFCLAVSVYNYLTKGGENMYQCPGCGGELRFDIGAQALGCKNCGQFYDPYDITKTQDAEESEELDVTVYKCPGCGGEILSKDTTAANFCSFCGASTILQSRLTRMKRPKYIIPFKKTKEECKNEYEKMMRRAIFAPKALKSKECIDGFRGIYTPYWAYHVTQQGNMWLEGSKSRRRGDYIYTDHYELCGKIDSGYKGISYDASSSFDDDISARIAPFDVNDMKSFTPAFLTGFYADTADVPASAYKAEAMSLAEDESVRYIKKLPGTSGYGFGNGKCLLNTDVAETDSTMYPVWFMSYRNKDRVAYATVNGQTGRVTADLPVSIGKYMLGSAILAIPLFFILNLLFTFKPAVTLGIVTVVAIAANILYSVELEQILKKDKKLDDKGARYGKKLKSPGGKRGNMTKKKSSGMNAGSMVAIIFGIIWADVFLGTIIAEGGTALFAIIVTVAGVVSGIAGFNLYRKQDMKSKMPAFLLNTLSVLIAAVVMLINPVSDAVFYIAAVITMLVVLMGLIDLIRYYNVLATRKLPQFTEYKGGDDRA